MRRKMALAIVSFMLLIALLVLEIDHALTQNRSVEHDRLPDSVSVWMDLSLREPEPVGFSFSTRRAPRPVQHPQEQANKNTAAGD